MRVEIPGGHRATKMAAWRCLHEAQLLTTESPPPCGGQGLWLGAPFLLGTALIFSALRADA